MYAALKAGEHKKSVCTAGGKKETAGARTPNNGEKDPSGSIRTGNKVKRCTHDH